jgi:hypothetical protein
MKDKVYKFPSIEHFRSVIKEVNHRVRFMGTTEDGNPIYDESEGIMPTLTFRGSVKLHGTNASIVRLKNQHGNIKTQVQSRTNILTPLKDNAGFATFVTTIDINQLIDLVKRNGGLSDYNIIQVYGEWCGGNIQKGVALNDLEKMFVIFAIKADDIWFKDDELRNIKIPEQKVYNILDYPTYEINIDFNNVSESADIITKYVEDIEKECPVGKAFGKSGIGEGLVFVCTTEGWRESRFWFKAKGEKHQSSKTKKKVPIDIERVNNINQLIDGFLTESRLNQGIDFLMENHKDVSRKSTGDYLRWVYEDVVKEELDTITGNGFEPKDISSILSNKARKWFFEKIDKLLV